jgi:small subunit ribosomal protein S20
MATSAQAKKRVRQNNKTQARQKAQVTSMRTAASKVRTAVDENADNTQELLNNAIKSIDKAASKGLIHENRAARKKSTLQKLVNNN